MLKPIFFADSNVLYYLLSKNINDSNKYDYSDLIFNLIDISCCFDFHSDKKMGILKGYMQYDKDDNIAIQTGILVHKRASDMMTLKAKFPGFEELMEMIYDCSMKLSSMMQEKDLKSLYGDIDPDDAVIVLKKKKNELVWKVVSDEECPILVDMDDFDKKTLGNMILDDKIVAAEDGDIEAMEELAMLYMNGDEALDIEPNPEKGVYWSRKAAEAGDVMDMFNMGDIYAK